MVNNRRLPTGGVVAIIAGGGGNNVVGALASSNGTVMTGFTRRRGLRVVDRYSKCAPARPSGVTTRTQVSGSGM